MHRAALALVLASAAAPAVAQDARIKSGEHETFSRLVIYMPSEAEYETESGADSFAIEFDASFDFDASDVFYYIPRDRVADLETAPGRLKLDLDCECAVTVERVSESIVFLDVNDPGTVTVVEDTASADLRAAPEKTELPRPASPVINLPVLTSAYPATLLPGGLSLPFAERALDAAETSGAPTGETTKAVAEQIARATTQGLLDVRDVTPRQLEADDPGPAAAEPEPALEEASVDQGITGHLSIRSSIDEALGTELRHAFSELGPSGTCIEDAAFDAATWAPNGFRDISRLRTKVIGEFDHPEPNGVARLARAYIALTFGAEARHTIETFRSGVPDADILLAMADIVDHSEARRPGRLVEQYDCRGAGAMWAALSQTEIPDNAELDTHAVTLAFSALPPELRKRLGPILAERLLNYGASEAASVVRTAIVRAPGPKTVEIELLDAEIALDAGHEEAGQAKLAEVVEQTSGRSIEAVQRLLARRLDEGGKVDDELLAAADALIYEHRGTPAAHKLMELRVEGLARSGQARRALAVLGDGEKHLPTKTVDRLKGISYTEAARQLEEADFLLVAVRASDELGTSPEEMAARRAVARRLTHMELFGLAETLGVEEGMSVDVAAAPRVDPAAVPNFRTATPETEETLARATALIDKSAALRERLASALALPAE